MKIVFGAGGSGGHIVPAIAVAERFLASGHSVAFIGNANSMEQELCKTKAFEFYPINVQKLYRHFTFKHLLFPFFMLISTIKACLYLKKSGSSAVFCTGGFVSGPIALAAVITRSPLFFHESNSYPGLTTRIFARRCKEIYTAFEIAAKYLPYSSVFKVGIPLKTELIVASQTIDSKRFLNQEQASILILGGSQGSMAINAVVDAIVSDLLDGGFIVYWQTGKIGYEKYNTKYSHEDRVSVFAFTNDIVSLYSKAGLAICRSGAMTIAELEAMQLPAILVPLPTSAENHQYHNAVQQVNKGCAMMLIQAEMNPGSLLSAIKQVLNDRRNYIEKLALQPQNKAAEQIMDRMIGILQGEKDVR